MTNDNNATTTRKIKPIEVGAGAGAAVITAFASSYLGTAGTLTGAAVASVVGTVSTALLRTSAETSAARLREGTARLKQTRSFGGGEIDPYGTQVLSQRDWIDSEPPGAGPPGAGPTGAGPSGAGPSGAGASGAGPSGIGPDAGPSGAGASSAGPSGIGPEAGPSGAGPAGTALGQGSTDPVGTPAPTGPTELFTAHVPGSASAGITGSRRPVRPRWVMLGAGAVVAFALALIAITGIESAAGKPLAGLVGRETGGGTTLGRATGGESGGAGSNQPATPTSTPGPSATSTGTSPDPSRQPAPSVTGGSVQPTPPSTGSDQGATEAPAPPTRAPTQAPSPQTTP